ncbi:hypothetical protein KUTeg_023834 [Tegillarca granosa]|uniref:Uncharacterized protein n=1 Tax=Tegillarca granosa TaxID=220873 RepID=A0ABQ9E629_TEGGR|nr:hypothetical protein KUTeg_023834 [Tegillarca granosa]
MSIFSHILGTLQKYLCKQYCFTKLMDLLVHVVANLGIQQYLFSALSLVLYQNDYVVPCKFTVQHMPCTLFIFYMVICYLQIFLLYYTHLLVTFVNK